MKITLKEGEVATASAGKGKGKYFLWATKKSRTKGERPRFYRYLPVRRVCLFKDSRPIGSGGRERDVIRKRTTWGKGVGDGEKAGTPF